MRDSFTDEKATSHAKMSFIQKEVENNLPNDVF